MKSIVSAKEAIERMDTELANNIKKYVEENYE